MAPCAAIRSALTLCEYSCSVVFTSECRSFVDVQMLTFHLAPCRCLAGKRPDKPDQDFVLDSPAIGFPQGAEVQHPGFAFFAVLFFEPPALMSLCHQISSGT